MERQLRCQACGSRVSAPVSELQMNMLRRDGYLERFCRECGATTHWLPLSTLSSNFREPVHDPDSEPQRRVLLIDDDPDILTVLGKALTGDSFEVDTARSARDALMRLAREDYDIILSDIRMPEFDGKQLFSFLDEKMPEYKQRVIFLTGDAGSSDTADFLKRTKAPYLAKPVDLVELKTLILRAMKAAGGSND